MWPICWLCHLSISLQDLYVTTNNGEDWRQVSKGVDKAVWGVLHVDGEAPVANQDTADTIYYTYGAMAIDDMILEHCK